MYEIRVSIVHDERRRKSFKWTTLWIEGWSLFGRQLLTFLKKYAFFQNGLDYAWIADHLSYIHQSDYAPPVVKKLVYPEPMTSQSSHRLLFVPDPSENQTC